MDETFPIFKHLKNLPEKTISIFKVACLRKKCNLYNDSILSLGAIIKQQEAQKTYVKIELYFGNKASKDITDFYTKFYGYESKLRCADF